MLTAAETDLLQRALDAIAELTGPQRDTIRDALTHLPALNSLLSALAAQKKRFVQWCVLLLLILIGLAAFVPVRCILMNPDVHAG